VTFADVVATPAMQRGLGHTESFPGAPVRVLRRPCDHLDFCPFAGHRSLSVPVVLAIYAAGARAYKMVSCNDLGSFENVSVCVGV
jgi:hypothetical protein